MIQIRKVVIVGGGVLGSQIAFQTAYCGFDVTILEIDKSINAALNKIEKLRFIYLKAVDDMKHGGRHLKGITGMKVKKLSQSDFEMYRERIENAAHKIIVTSNYEEACKNADLVIEAIIENPKAKIAVYKKLAKYLEKDTILATNSSTLLPSSFAPYTGRPEKYLAIHFANKIWKSNIAEIMGHSGTEQKYIDIVFHFAMNINMIPLRVLKEHGGYILNSILVPFIDSAESLWADDIAKPETIDKTWKLATGSPVGPFEILDIVGLETTYNIKLMKPDAKDPNSKNYKVVQKLKKMIDNGKLGVSSGEGFYKYQRSKI